MTTTSTHLYLRLLSYTRVHAKVFALGILAMVIFALTEPAVPALMKPLLDGTFVERDPDYLFWMPILIVLLFTVRSLANFASQTAIAWVASRVVYDIRIQMFERLLLLPSSYYDQIPTGNLISKVTYDVNQVMTAATQVLTILVRDSFAVIGLIAYVFWLDWRLSLVIFVLAPTIGVVVQVLGKRLRRLNRNQQANIGDLTHVLEESVRGHKVVKIQQGQDWEGRRFEHFANLARRYFYKIQVSTAAHGPVVELFGAVAMAVIIYIGTSDAYGSAMTVGGFVSFFGALAMLFAPLKRLTKLNAPIQKGLAAAESVFALIDQDGERDTGTQTIQRARGELTFAQVSFAYAQDGERVLEGIDIHIAPQETVALVGASGSGKSTLTALIPRLYNIEQGRLLLDGLDVHDLKLNDLRRQIAYVSQDVVLFNDSIAGNIAYGLNPRPDDDAIEQAARAAHAWEFIAKLPEGLATLIGENGVRLSGGQRQRLALARALLKDAPILILDEATSALDSESEKAVQQSLEEQRHRRTTLIIAHRLSTVEFADRILVMDQGRIVEQGSHAELLKSDGVYQRLYRTQFAGN